MDLELNDAFSALINKMPYRARKYKVRGKVIFTSTGSLVGGLSHDPDLLYFSYGTLRTLGVEIVLGVRVSGKTYHDISLFKPTLSWT